MTSLKTVLRLNALSCLFFGAMFVFAPKSVPAALGHVPSGVLVTLGVVLLLNGAHLILAAQRRKPWVVEIIWFTLGDLAWWLMTMGIVASGFWITTPFGLWAAIIVATIVAVLGVLQMWALGTGSSDRSSRAHFAAIVTSWLALPHWVKLWLALLNGVFFWVIIFAPETLSRMTLIAFVATGPLLMAQLAHDGGLRRILGLSHLVPWGPFLIWLPLQTSAETLIYTVPLFIVVLICLAFDVVDMILFWRGDRKVFGTG